MRVRMKSAERRDAIVRSAIHLFAEKGFRGATTQGTGGGGRGDRTGSVPALPYEERSL